MVCCGSLYLEYLYFSFTEIEVKKTRNMGSHQSASQSQNEQFAEKRKELAEKEQERKEFSEKTKTQRIAIKKLEQKKRKLLLTSVILTNYNQSMREKELERKKKQIADELKELEEKTQMFAIMREKELESKKKQLTEEIKELETQNLEIKGRILELDRKILIQERKHVQN